MASCYEPVFTDDMEYPEGMTDDEANAIHYALERRYVAEEVAFRLNNPSGWEEDIVMQVERGNVTCEELFESVFARYWDRRHDEPLSETVYAGMIEAVTTASEGKEA